MKQRGKKVNFNSLSVEVSPTGRVQGFDWMWAAEHEDGVTIEANYRGSENSAKKKDTGLKLITVEKSNAVVFSNNEEGSRSCFISQNIAMLAKSKTKPNLYITDTERDLYEMHAEALRKAGYEVYLVDFSDAKVSDKWNPLHSLVWRVKLIRELENELENRDGKYYAIGEEFTTYKQVRDRARELRESMYAEISIMTVQLFTNKNSDNMQALKLIEAFLVAMCEDCIASKLCTSQLLLTNVYQNLLKYGVEGNGALKTYLMDKRNRYSKAKQMMKELCGNDAEKNLQQAVSGAIYAMAHGFDDTIGWITSESIIDLYTEEDKQIALFVVQAEKDSRQQNFVELLVNQAYVSRQEIENMQSRRMEYRETPVPKARPSYFIINAYKELPNFDFGAGLFQTEDDERKLILVAKSYTQLTSQYGKGFEGWIKYHCNVKMFLSADDVESKKDYCELCCGRIDAKTEEEKTPTFQEIEIFDKVKGVGNAVVSLFNGPPKTTQFTPAYKLYGLYFPEEIHHCVEKAVGKILESDLFDIAKLLTDDKAADGTEVMPMR